MRNRFNDLWSLKPTGLCLVAFGVLLTAFTRCSNQPTEVAGANNTMYQGAVSDLRSMYLPDSGKILLTWSQPAGDVAGYALYRTNTRDYAGNVDLSTFVLQSVIPGGQTSCYDVIGLSNTVYFYIIKAVFLDFVSSGGGTVVTEIEGPGSNLDSCDIGNDLTFAINYGDLFLTIDTCNLVIVDKLQQIRAVRFTDSLVRRGSGATATDSAVFLDNNIRNTIVDYSVSAQSRHVFPWVLLQGNGSKIVAARITLANGRDTIFKDDIKIKPYRIAIKLRNPSDSTDPNRSMVIPSNKASTDAGSFDQYSICRPWIDYSVSIFSDTTFARDFAFWIVMADSGTEFKIKDATTIDTTKPWILLNNSKTYWQELDTANDALTGFGAAHNDLKVYRYSFCPDSADGRKHLGTIRRSGFRPGSSKPVDQFSVPGNFWGAPEGLASGKDTFRIYTGLDPYTSFAKIRATTPSNIQNNGVKEIAMIVRMKGRYFNDVRTFISSPNINKTANFFTNFAMYPPILARDAFEYFYPADGAILSGNVSINSNTSGVQGGLAGSDAARGYVKCLSGARIKAIDLVFSQMPDYLIRTWSTGATNPTWPKIRVDSLFVWPHRIIPYAVPNLQSAMPGIAWTSIDLRNWATGDYLMTVVTTDEFDNTGIAPFRIGLNLQSGSSNPQHIKIINNQ